MRITMTPTTREFELESVPAFEGIRAVIAVRQAKEAETIEEGNLFAEQTHVFEDSENGRYQVKRRWNPHELIRYRAFKLLTACNLEDENGVPLFKFWTDKRGIGHIDMPQNEFFRNWGLLPREIVDEIYTCILEVNPQWKIVGEREGE